jgi:peptidoglycan/LPS O-acetylase OafA/YrhL
VAVFMVRYVPFHWMPQWLGKFSQSAIPWSCYVTFTQNIWMALYGTFGVGAMAATWSLAVEEQFYLTVPLVVRKINRSHLIYVLGAVVVGAPMLRTLLLWKFQHGAIANYVLMPTRADALSMGVIAALMVRSPRWWRWLVTNRSSLYAISGVLFLGLAWFTYQGYGMTTGPMVTIGFSGLALFYTCFLLLGVTRSSGYLHRLLCSNWLTQLGVLAYFTYLAHFSLMEAGRRILGIRFVYATVAIQFLGGILGIVLSLILAKFSWKYFEKPLLRRGHAYRY